MSLRSSSADREHLAHAERRAEHGALLRVLARLDAQRDLDLALAREQRDLAHLAQVDAHRIVGGRVVDRLRAAPSGAARGRRPATTRMPALADERAHLFEAARRRASLGSARGHLLGRQVRRVAGRPRRSFWIAGSSRSCSAVAAAVGRAALRAHDRAGIDSSSIGRSDGDSSIACAATRW